MARACVRSKSGWIVISNWEDGKIVEIFSKKPGQKIKGTVIKTNTWYWFENGGLKSEECK
jgi:saccharopine dehydrogenase-like NADP-dependent oxidoreductase